MEQYITIVDSYASGSSPTIAMFDTLEDAYEQFKSLSEGIGYTGKIPSIGEIRGGVEYDNFNGFRVRLKNKFSVMIFQIDDRSISRMNAED